MSDLRLNEGPPQEDDPYDDAALTRSITPWNPNTVRGEPVVKTLTTESPLHAIEVTLGVEPMDVLEAELDAMSDEWARGWALFGPGGMLDAQRKALLSAREVAIKDEWDDIKQGKMTDGKIEAAAHADPTYRKWLDDMQLCRAQWVLLDQARSLIHARIARGNALLRASARG